MYRGRKGLLVIREFTHPVIASLDHPLFAARKEGFFCFYIPSLRSREGAGGE
jgi:hypothetical protein